MYKCYFIRGTHISFTTFIEDVLMLFYQKSSRVTMTLLNLNPFTLFPQLGVHARYISRAITLRSINQSSKKIFRMPVKEINACSLKSLLIAICPLSLSVSFVFHYLSLLLFSLCLSLCLSLFLSLSLSLFVSLSLSFSVYLSLSLSSSLSLFVTLSLSLCLFFCHLFD